LLGRLQTQVWSLKSTNLPFFRCHIFVSFRNTVGINCTFTTTHHSGFPPAPTRMTLNDLECPIHLKVRLLDGTFDVRLLRVWDSTIRIDAARGCGGPSPPPPCGQLTRCLSAVAELLVISAASNVPRPTKVATHPDLEPRPQPSRPRPRPRTWPPCLPLTESVHGSAY